MAVAHFQPGTVLVRRFAVAILMLAVAFFGAGCGPLLPRWMTVIGTNVVLLSAGVMFYTAFAAYCAQRGKPGPAGLERGCAECAAVLVLGIE